MSQGRRLRLNQVAREFNVGIGTITEFLAKKGVKVKTSPSTIIGADAYTLLEKEFGANRADARVNIRERINIGKESVSLDDKKESDEKETESDFEEEEIVIKSPGVITAKDRVRSPKFLGKIELDDDNIPVSSSKAEKKETKPQEQPAVEKEAVQAQSEKKIEVPKAEQAPKTEVPKTKAPKKESKPKDAPKVAETSKSKQEATVKKEADKIPPKVKADAPKTKPTAKTDASSKDMPKTPPTTKKEEAKPIIRRKTYDERQAADTSDVFRPSGDATSIRPKVVGKIDVDKLDKKNEGRKGRRKRITKDKVDVTKQQQQTGGAKKPRRAPGAPGTPRAAGATGTATRAQSPKDTTKKGKGRVRGQRQVRPEVSEEEVQQQIKETLARLTSRGGARGGKQRGGGRRDRRDAITAQRDERERRIQKEKHTIQVTEFVTVKELATMMDVGVTEVITACMNLGLMVSINQRLDAEALSVVAEEFGFEVDFVAIEIQEAIEELEDKPEELEPRPPIVTVMGHVDHGKTSLLDNIRKTNVTADEAGGITQHIGAYSVVHNGRKITFLDTPGHEAFTAMRARGAKITDVAIIIVAADDSVMPQTVEAINHAAAAGVPIVFAINKIDKPTANTEKIKEELGAMNYLVEEWGGKYQSQEISAKMGTNLDKLLEKVLLEAELLDLRANPNRKAEGFVIESSLDKGRGYVSTVLIENGTLHVGDVLLSGQHSGRVKAMYDEHGQEIDKALPATPVVVLGLNGAPQSGDSLNVMDDDRSARELANKREQLQRMQGIRTQKHITLDEIGRRIAIGNFKELNIIVKGDVDGSIEAITDSLLKLSHEEVQVNVIHKAVGQISESDVILGTASNAIIVGFQVRPSLNARRLAEKEEIEIRLYSIIYDVINDIEAAIEGMLAPVTKEEIVASLEVLEIFKSSKFGTIAGCIVREGKMHRSTTVRVIRDGIVIYTGKLGSLKRYKDDVREVTLGMECGLNIENFNDIKVGDIVEGYQIVEVARKI